MPAVASSSQHGCQGVARPLVCRSSIRRVVGLLGVVPCHAFSPMLTSHPAGQQRCASAGSPPLQIKGLLPPANRVGCVVVYILLATTGHCVITGRQPWAPEPLLDYQMGDGCTALQGINKAGCTPSGPIHTCTSTSIAQPK